VHGFRLYAVRPQTVIAALGLLNGDSIRGVNGFDTPTVERFAELLAQLRPAPAWTIDIERRHQPMILTVMIR
jgi:type II secretory pathway component PulC